MSNSADSPRTSQVVHSLEPLNVTGITTATIGTVVWAIATVVLFAVRGSLADSGRGDWPIIAATGTFLGLLGIRYARRRAARLERSATSQLQDPPSS